MLLARVLARANTWNLTPRLRCACLSHGTARRRGVRDVRGVRPTEERVPSLGLLRLRSASGRVLATARIPQVARGACDAAHAACQDVPTGSHSCRSLRRLMVSGSDLVKKATLRDRRKPKRMKKWVICIILHKNLIFELCCCCWTYSVQNTRYTTAAHSCVLVSRDGLRCSRVNHAD